MNRIAAPFFGHGNQPRHIEIGGDSLSGETIGFIGSVSMEGPFIVRRVNRHGGQVKLGSGPKDPNGNFAAISDQKFLHG